MLSLVCSWSGEFRRLFLAYKIKFLILIRNAPSYIARANSETERWINLPILSNFHGDLESMLSDFSARMVNYAENFSSSALTWVGSFASTVARVTVAIILAPFHSLLPFKR